MFLIRSTHLLFIFQACCRAAALNHNLPLYRWIAALHGMNGFGFNVVCVRALWPHPPSVCVRTTDKEIFRFPPSIAHQFPTLCLRCKNIQKQTSWWPWKRRCSQWRVRKHSCSCGFLSARTVAFLCLCAP